MSPSPRGVMMGRVRHGPAVALVALLVGLGVGLPGCAGRRQSEDGTTRPRRLRFAHADRVAYGRPATCPDDAVDVFGDGRPGPDDLRCSYADTAGGELVRVAGRVQYEGGVNGVLGEGLADVAIVVQEIRKGGVPGRIVARATTNAQGGFSVGAVLRAGEYQVAIPSAVPGSPRALRRFEIEAGARSVDRLDLIVPGR